MIYSIGLKKVLVGNVAESISAMPAAMGALGRTYKGTASFETTQQATKNDFFVEEQEAPAISAVSQAAVKAVKFSVIEWDNASLQKVFGGSIKTENVTIEGKTYNGVEKYVPPAKTVQKEMSVRVLSANGVVLDVPRAAVKADFNWPLTGTEIAKVEIELTLLAPTSGGTYALYALPEDEDE
jgi:hypothetical protein